MNRAQRLTAAAPAVLVAISLGVASLAHAGAGNDVPQERVRFGDLNLSAPGAAQTLYGRIESAARTVCGPSEITGSRIVLPAWKACVSDAVRHTILKINRPELTSYYVERLGALPTQARAVP